MRRVALIVVFLVLAAISAMAEELPPQAAVLPPVEDRAPIAWAAEEPYFVIADRSCRTVTVYRRGEWLRTYHDAVFGRAEGRKVYRGDRRTPEGLYSIVAKRRHPRWSRFLLLDYPGPADIAAHRDAFAAGAATADAGSAIGIHGSDAPLLNRTGTDWTLGCVSLHDSDVDDLYRQVPIGTPVWLRP